MRVDELARSESRGTTGAKAAPNRRSVQPPFAHARARIRRSVHGTGAPNGVP
jgi:hypothetical protein